MTGERALHPATSPRSDAVVAVCGLARHQRAYVLDGLRRSASCRFVDTFAELDDVLSQMARCDAIVLAPRDSDGRDALATVERVARDWPDTAIVLFFPARREQELSIRSLAIAGAHQFVFEGVHDTASTLAQAVENAGRDCAAAAVFARLAHLIPTALHSIVHAVLTRPDVLTSVQAAASALGLHRRTLVRRCARLQFLLPAELIVWCRLAIVAYRLERTGATIESIGLTLGFPSHTALRNIMKRYTGYRSTDIRRRGGVALVVSALETRLAAWQQRHREALPIE